MKVLVGCEFSQIVTEAFIKKGHDAMSCDLLPGEKGLPHYQGNIFDVVDYPWDLAIFHPECTHTAVSGAKHFKLKKLTGLQQAAVSFFYKLLHSTNHIQRTAIEQPISIISTIYRKPDQIIHPNYFGDEAKKSTCLWLKGLPKLKPTNIVGEGETVIHGGKKFQKWYSNRTRNRSVTFPGIAKAMAEQWGNLNGEAFEIKQQGSRISEKSAMQGV